MQWRGELRSQQTGPMLNRLLDAPVQVVEPGGLMREAWKVSEEMGWAKTYDANYVALARMSACKLVTIDARMRRATARLGFVVGPTEFDEI